jgi:hypothetical protein
MPVTKDKDENAKALCKCGKSFVISNKYGMFFEDMCGYKISVEAENS